MTSPAASRRSLLSTDVQLLTVVLIWGGNYSLLKLLFAHLPPLAFNALRMAVASLVYLGLVWWGWGGRERASFRRLTMRDGVAIAGLGLVGHFLYQICFTVGLSKTSVANSVLIMGSSPILVALASAAAGHERIRRAHWLGLALSLTGLYFVAGHGARFGGQSAIGDALVLGGTCCWAIYTVSSRGLLTRYSPLFLNAITVLAGTTALVPTSWSAVTSVDWTLVPRWVWLGTVLSAVLAINVSYVIWYTAVQRIGAARTAVFSNMIPLAGISIAWLVLREPIELSKLLGGSCILAGIALTRLVQRQRVEVPPPEE